MYKYAYIFVCTMLRILYTSSLVFEMVSIYVEAYIEYESQSQGIRSQRLPKQKRIVIAQQLQNDKKHRFQFFARSQKRRSHICYLDRASIQIF